ncbi:hydrogenase formation protein HypD [Synechococcus sp. CBW1004]|uniref:hydrogenase formation protein HypD n=1 Tax=Synechococcus sp. CBW1004 TaxID=1353136 RepID=UPI002106F013|nr:hydrogenase formation protein HypD [Synechococcus sp. CBW1004]
MNGATAPGTAIGGVHAVAGDVVEAGRNRLGSVAAVQAMAAELKAITTRPWTLMEVCGGQTHAIVRWGLDQLLPEGLRLIHGPGCPVCVTPARTIEQALALARRPDVILYSYGDMLRVPGEGRDTLLSVRAAGGDVRLLTSPLQALALACNHPDRQVVFLAVGFETTAPATALLARQALTLGVGNLSLLAAHVRVSPAMEAILADPANRVQGFLAAGHVCSVLGTAELEQLVEHWRLPVVVTGFEPLELMAGVLACVRQLEGGEARVENAYDAVVQAAGNPAARLLLEEVFEPCDRPWRGLGVMAGGGLALRGPYRALDAIERFRLERGASEHPTTAPAASSPARETPTETRHDRHGAGPRRPSTDGVGCPTCGIAAAETRPIHAPPPSAPPATGAQTGVSDSEWSPTSQRCIAGSILRGLATPQQCPAFGTTCTPEHPLGAPMVSSEGACAAYFLYRHRAGLHAKQDD